MHAIGIVGWLEFDAKVIDNQKIAALRSGGVLMYRALTTFVGAISMRKGEVRAIENKAVAADLVRAGYVEKVKAEETKPKKKKNAQKGVIL